MPRDKNNRQRKHPTRKTTRDGMEERSENLGDSSRGEFDIRTEHREDTLGRGFPRDTPDFVRETITRHNQEQARRFTGHAAGAANSQDTGGSQPPVQDTGGAFSDTDTAYKFSLEDGTETQRKCGSARRRRINERRKVKPNEAAPHEYEDAPHYTERSDTSTKNNNGERLRHDSTHRQCFGEPHRDRLNTAEPRLSDTAPCEISYTDTPLCIDTFVSEPARDTERQAEQSKDSSLELSSTARDTKPNSTAPTAPDKKAGKKYDKAQSKADRSSGKLEKAQKNLPKKRRIKVKHTFDDKKQKPKRKLVFEEEDGGRLPVKSQHAHLKGSLVTRPVKTVTRSATRFAHSKVFQFEDENVAVKAAHRAEMLAEGGLRTAYRLHKTAPYRKVERLTRRTTKLNVKASYQKALRDNPKLKSNPISRMMQKRRNKKQYAKAARDAEKAGIKLKKSATIVGRMGKAVGRVIVKIATSPKLLLIVGIFFLLFIIIASLFTTCANMGSGVSSIIVTSSYLAHDEDVDNAELAYTEWETDLLLQIGRTEADFPGYDEYRYQIDNVGHNLYELMAFLTVAYQEFTYSQVEAVLRQMFAEQYQLTFTPSTEIRYRTVTLTDPNTGEDYEDTEAYDWHVMTVTLTSLSFTEVIGSRITFEQRPHYDLLVRTKGSRQYAGSPFDFNWLHHVSSFYGYRIHPITSVKDYHMGIDIAVPTGTDIRATHDGTVSIGNDAGGYGLYLTLTGVPNGDGDILVTRFAHLDSVLVSDGQTVKSGDVIAKSGNSGSSTGPHLHFEVLMNGRHINPAYFAMTNDFGSGQA